MRSKHAGFTLVELMIVVAVVAILTAIGLPSFSATIRANRIATRTNALIAAVSLARSEAVRSNVAAGLCARATDTTCGVNWDNGWLVFTDTNGDGAPSASEVDRVTSGNSDMTVTGTAGTILFTSRGMNASGAAGAFVLTPSNCPSGIYAVNTLTMNTVGQVSTVKSGCP